MGHGELVSLEWGSDVDRTSLRVVYDDPQLLGTWWRGRVSHADNSDGSMSELAVGRPFYSLDTRWSAGTDLSSATAAWLAIAKVWCSTSSTNRRIYSRFPVAIRAG